MRRPPLVLLFSAIVLVELLSGRAEGQPSVEDQPAAVRATPSSGETVELHIETILATNSSRDFDDRLNPIRSQLDIFRYSSYWLVQEKRRQVGWGKQAEFLLPGGRFLHVVPKEYVDEQIALQVVLMEGAASTPLLSTLLRIRNRAAFFVGGRKHQEGMLIIRIGAAAAEREAAPAYPGE